MDKLSRNDIMLMTTYIPLMLDDLKGCRDYTKLKEKWNLLLQNGGKGHELVNLYMKIKQKLPSDKVTKYP